MRPMAVLVGIIMGSAVAMSVSLTMSAIVFLLLPEYSVRLAPERLPLLKGLLWSWSLAAVGGASFIGELKHWRWRYAAQKSCSRPCWSRSGSSTGPEAPQDPGPLCPRQVRRRLPQTSRWAPPSRLS